MDVGIFLTHNETQTFSIHVAIEEFFSRTAYHQVFLAPQNQCPTCDLSLDADGHCASTLFTLNGPKSVTHVRFVFQLAWLISRRKRCRKGHGSFFFGYSKLQGKRLIFNQVTEYFQKSSSYFFEVRYLRQVDLQMYVLINLIWLIDP